MSLPKRMLLEGERINKQDENRLREKRESSASNLSDALLTKQITYG